MLFLNSARQRGVTLIELLVALVLSSFLIAAVYQIFLSNRMNVILSDSFSEVQESGRIASELLARDLRMAGFMGCVNTRDKLTNNLDPASAKTKDFYLSDIDADGDMDTIIATDFTSGSRVIGGMNVKLGTDIIEFKTMQPSDIFLDARHFAGDVGFSVTGPTAQLNEIVPGKVLMITNCESAQVFAVSAVTSVAGAVNTVSHALNTSTINNTSATFAVDYAEGSPVLFPASYTYFIARSNLVVDDQGVAISSLYRYSNNDATAQELVPFVEDLQITYGVNTGAGGANSSADTYYTATTAAAAGVDLSASAVSIRLELVISARADVDAAALTGLVAGAAAPSDGKLRRRYSRLIYLRNSSIGNL